jgi:tellurite resistance protein TerC
VFLIIFRYFSVPEGQQHRVLFWGILGALVMRGLFILAGVSLIQRFHWVVYGFGALLVYSGVRVGVMGEKQIDPAKNPVVRALRRVIRVTDEFQGGRFFVRDWKGKPGLYATPLLIVLAMIETSDVLFAVDSIPAVLAITLNAFVVYTSNVFAILGLRSIYFAVAGLMKVFRFLHYGLAAVLILVGAKMMASEYFPVPTLITLSVVAGVLTVAIVASVVAGKEPAA